MAIAHVTGFPFHPPADEQEGTIHFVCGILSQEYLIVTALLSARTRKLPAHEQDNRQAVLQFWRIKRAKNIHIATIGTDNHG